MTETDKKNLFRGKNCIAAFFAKRKLLNKLNVLINKADELLEKYPEVIFGNEYTTALYQTNGILLSYTTWSAKAEKELFEAFGNQISDIALSFGNTRWTQANSQYANIRCTLVMKSKILVKLRKDIKEL